MMAHREIHLDPALGISGDHYAGKAQRRRRVTLIQHEHLAVTAAFGRRPACAPAVKRYLETQIVGVSTYDVLTGFLSIHSASDVGILTVSHR